MREAKEPDSELRKQIKQIDDYLISRNLPKVYYGPEGFEARSYRKFEQTCTILAQQNVHADPRRMSAFSFLSALQTLRDQQKKSPKGKGGSVSTLTRKHTRRGK